LIEDITPPVEAGWVVRRQWYTIANDDDPEGDQDVLFLLTTIIFPSIYIGWQYAMDFSSLNWYPKVSTGLYVRRRAWRREVAAVDKIEKAATIKRRGRKISDED
jgi:hypothetical protein